MNKSSSWPISCNVAEPFRQKIEEYMKSSETNSIFKHDMHTMVHLAETEEDLQTLRKMIVRYNVLSYSSK